MRCLRESRIERGGIRSAGHLPQLARESLIAAPVAGGCETSEPVVAAGGMKNFGDGAAERRGPAGQSAARVLIKKAAADIEILVVAGWQGRAFVFGKPLRESNHPAGRRRWPV
jgi:hypothetical protein